MVITIDRGRRIDQALSSATGETDTPSMFRALFQKSASCFSGRHKHRLLADAQGGSSIAATTRRLRDLDRDRVDQLDLVVGQPRRRGPCGSPPARPSAASASRSREAAWRRCGRRRPTRAAAATAGPGVAGALLPIQLLGRAGHLAAGLGLLRPLPGIGLIHHDRIVQQLPVDPRQRVRQGRSRRSRPACRPCRRRRDSLGTASSC